MPTSNRIILTDVDGVLLEWEHHFTEWMLQRSYYNDKGERVYPYKLLPDKQNTYEMAERFGLTIPAIRKEIREFNKSAWMATQCPMPESQTWVKLLAAEGWTFVPITSQTSDIPAQQLRKKRLGELWSELNENELEEWSSKASQDKERYNEEYEAYQDLIHGSIYNK